MNKTFKWLVPSLSLIFLCSAGLVFAERGEHEDDDERGGISRWFKPERMESNTQESKLYRDECGGCHFPFQPGFLPAASWQRLMGGLADHFGENAELSDENSQRILDFLVANSAGNVNREIPNKVMWSLRYTPEPTRITETAFFRHEHREIPPWVLENKGEPISFANCDTCHSRALQGSYREREIRIPGVGRWED